MSRMQNDINIFKRNLNGRPLFDSGKYMPDIMNPHKSQKKHFEHHHDSEIGRLAALDNILSHEPVQLAPEDPRNVINGYYQQFLPNQSQSQRQQTERNRSVNRDEISNLLQPNTMRVNRSPDNDIDTLDKFKRDYDKRKNSQDNSFHLEGYHMQSGKNLSQPYDSVSKNDASFTKLDANRGRYLQTEFNEPSIQESPMPLRYNKANTDAVRPNLLQEANNFRERPPSNRNNVSKSLEPKNFSNGVLNNSSLNQLANNRKPSPRYDNTSPFKLRVEPVYNNSPEISPVQNQSLQQMQRFNSHRPDLFPIPDSQPKSSPPMEKSSKLLDQGYKGSPGYNFNNKKVMTYNIIANKPIQRELPKQTRLPYKYAWEMSKDIPGEIEETLTKLTTLEQSGPSRENKYPDPSTSSIDRLKNYDPKKNGNVFTLALRNEINGLYNSNGKDNYDSGSIPKPMKNSPLY